MKTETVRCANCREMFQKQLKELKRRRAKGIATFYCSRSCSNESKIRNLSNQQFGRLLAQEIAGRNSSSDVLWECLCSCGNKKVVRSNDLTQGRVRSCGCLKKEVKPNLKHGHTASGKDTPTYSTWSAMKFRCSNPGSSNWDRYGGKGVTVDERWENFETFLSDMGEKPGKGWHLHRIDSEGNYEPSNCVWIEVGEHMRLHAKARRQQASTP